MGGEGRVGSLAVDAEDSGIPVTGKGILPFGSLDRSGVGGYMWKHLADGIGGLFNKMLRHDSPVQLEPFWQRIGELVNLFDCFNTELSAQAGVDSCSAWMHQQNMLLVGSGSLPVLPLLAHAAVKLSIGLILGGSSSKLRFSLVCTAIIKLFRLFN